MEITKITLKNIRCFENLEIDLSRHDGAKKWLVILGDNGVGKTTVLRSIALGLCEEAGASALLAELAGEWIRTGAEKGTIRIELKPYPGYNGVASIETTLTRSDYGEYKLQQLNTPKTPSDFSWEKLFVCAYGAGRGVFGTADLSEYAVTDSVYSLFNYKSELQNPELNLRRIASEAVDTSLILRKLEKVLMVKEGAIALNKSGITIDGSWGKSMPTGTLSDGYVGTLTWLLDMYGWKLLFDEKMTDTELRGIIIVDELEQHLHPKWQKQIIKLLSDQFPDVQFITSSHSPLCVIGTTDLNDDECAITVLHQGEGKVLSKSASPPRGKRADQVLTSYLFELYSTSDNQIKNNIEQYNNLYKLERNDSQEVEFQRLYKYLNETLGSAETELEKKVGQVLNNTLNALFADKIKDESVKKSPENFELIRQLNELL